jgi:thioredoxin reductase (NADPH)
VVRQECCAVFCFIGATPSLDGFEVDRDSKGFVCTDVATSSTWVDQAALPFETNVRGVFAIGDVRAGSTKRVAAAVGEGSAVTASLHRRVGAG